MEHRCRRWVRALLTVLFALLFSGAALVYAIDPCLYYRLPDSGRAVFFNERYQNAGLAAHTHADTVLLGTSMVANYRQSHVADTFGGSAVKLTVPDGYLSEFDTVLTAVCRRHTPERVLFGLDINILVRDESGLTDALPVWLYDRWRWNDLRYLLSRDAVYYSAYTLRVRLRGGGTPIDEAFTRESWWNHLAALADYQRPEPVSVPLPADTYLANAKANVGVILDWAARYPNTEFILFFSPYSLLYWDRTIRQGRLDAVCAALDMTADTLLTADDGLENIRLMFLAAATDITWNLDYYDDYIHHSGAAADAALTLLRDGSYEVTRDNWPEMLENWRTFVTDYDYDQLWTETFWEAWNAAHAGES